MRPGAGDAVGDGVDVGASVGAAPTVGMGVVTVAAGAHALKNETDGPVRYLMASTQGSPEVAEYPDLGQITVQGPSGSQTGDRLWFIYDVPRATDG